MRPYLGTSLLNLPSLRLLLPTSTSTSTSTRSIPPRNVPFPILTEKPSFLRCRAMGTSSPPQPVAVQVKEKVELTEIEKKIFQRLLNTIRHFNLNTELRVAGGWVRDKLLGKDCYDIDIAIDNMVGSEFVDKVREYLLTTGEEAQGVGVIPRNPDQSKHLETARMRLFDLWIDFVNLRCEDYCENSRIPTMKFGTPKEDAYRRDLTINSLFYNINTSSVEDLTGRGIADLKSGKIVTPLSPKATFLDDPLRVLRAIRFGARFNFLLDEELKEAAACDDVKNALGAKVSKERIGTEIDLMISRKHPVQAMTYIADLTLFWIVFGLPSNAQPAAIEACHRHCVSYLDAAWNLIQLIDGSPIPVRESHELFSNLCAYTDEQKRLALYAALFLPFRNTTYEDKKGKKVPVVNFIFRDSLKQKASDPETVIKIFRSVEKFLTLIRFHTSSKETQLGDFDWGMEFVDVPVISKHRVFAGYVLREIKDLWRVALLISTMLYPADMDFTQLDTRKDLFKTVEKAVTELGLGRIWEVHPLVNGKDIMAILQLKSGGPVVREWQEKLFAWQLVHHPTGSKDECIDWMKETDLKRVRMEY